MVPPWCICTMDRMHAFSYIATTCCNPPKVPAMFAEALRFRSMHAWPRVVAGLALGLLLTACGGGGDASTPSPASATAVAAGQRAQVAVGVAGGTVVLASAEGVRVELALPAGALPSTTTVAITTYNASPSQRLHLRFSPADTLLASPATLTIALPDAMALPADGTLTYDGVPLPTTRLADGRLQVSITRFAAAPAAAGQAVANRLRALAGPSAPPCGDVPEFAESAMTALPTASVAQYGACMLGAVNALAQSGQFAEAVRLASSVSAYLQSIGADNASGSSTTFLTEARSLACTAYGQALDDAAATTVTSFATLTRAVKPVLFWEATVQQLGAVCPGIAPTRYVDVVQNLTSDALRFYAGKKGAVVDVGSVEYTEAVAELRASPQAVSQLRSLEAPEPVQTLARTQVQERAQPAIVDAVLQAPWQRCHDSGQFDKLIELMEQANSPAAVKTAAQYCGTLLQAQAKNAAGAVTATLSPSLGGVAAGNQRTSASLDVAKDGTLVLDGPIRALQCPVGSTGGSESLQLKLGSTVLQTVASAPYLQSSLVIDIAQALRTAGIEAASFTGATLTLTRTGSPCSGFWGDNPEPLLTLNLSSGVCVPAPGEAFCVTLVEVPTDAAYSPKRLNAAGQVLYEMYNHSTTACQPADSPEQKPCGAIWQRGQLRMLPDRFVPMDMAEDGSVGGHQLEGSTRAATGYNPAVVKAQASSSTVLARSIAPSGSDNLSGVGYLMKSYSLAGRATYVGVTGGYAYDQQDRGFCYTYPNLTYTLIYCWRETWYESTGPNHGSGTQIQSARLPDSPIYSWEVFMDGDAGGRIGYGHRFTPSEYFVMKDFTMGASLGTSIGGGAAYPIAVDAAGRTLRVASDNSTTLSADGDKLPAGTQASQLGPNGHAVACSTSTDSDPSFSLVNLRTGESTAPASIYKSVQVGSDTINLSISCYPSRSDSFRFLDAKGRLLVGASSDTRPRLRNAILTPRGQPLP